MSQIVLSAKALGDLQRFRCYLLLFNEDAVQKAAVTILEAASLLSQKRQLATDKGR